MRKEVLPPHRINTYYACIMACVCVGILATSVANRPSAPLKCPAIRAPVEPTAAELIGPILRGEIGQKQQTSSASPRIRDSKLRMSCYAPIAVNCTL